MRVVKITYGSGLPWVHTNLIELEDWECEQDAIDKLIDKLESENFTGMFINPDNIDQFNADEYVTGGNHGLHLHHHGVFQIEEYKKRAKHGT